MGGQLTFTNFGVHLKVTDVQRSRRFYESLGFVPEFGFGDDEFRASLPEGCGFSPEGYRGVIYRPAAGAEFEIAEGHPAVRPGVFAELIPSSKISLMVRVESLVPLLRDRDLDMVAPVRHYYWGSIEAVMRDPDGFIVVFISPYSAEELAAVSALVAVEATSQG